MYKDYEGSSARKHVRRVEAEIEYCWDHNVRIQLPEIFKPTFGGIFDTCVVCRDDLMDTKKIPEGDTYVDRRSPFLVFKEFRYGETRIEYAMCLTCFDDIRMRFSRGTVAKMDALFEPVAEFRARFDMLTQSYAPIDMWLDSCLLTGDRLEGAAVSMMQGICVGQDLILCSLPYTIAGKGVEMYEDCFSADSQKVVRKFVRKHFGVESVVYRK